MFKALRHAQTWVCTTAARENHQHPQLKTYFLYAFLMHQNSTMLPALQKLWKLCAPSCHLQTVFMCTLALSCERTDCAATVCCTSLCLSSLHPEQPVLVSLRLLFHSVGVQGCQVAWLCERHSLGSRSEYCLFLSDMVCTLACFHSALVSSAAAYVGSDVLGIPSSVHCCLEVSYHL